MTLWKDISSLFFFQTRKSATHSSRTLLHGGYQNPSRSEKSRGKAEILFPRKYAFRFAESELKPRHTARILGGQNPKKKNVLSIFRKNWSRANPKSKEHFSLGLPSGARQWRGFRSLRIFDKIGSSEVVKTLQHSWPVIEPGKGSGNGSFPWRKTESSRD